VGQPRITADRAGAPGTRRPCRDRRTRDARAYQHELPDAERHLLDTGHCALEAKGEQIAAVMRGFLDRALSRR